MYSIKRLKATATASGTVTTGSLWDQQKRVAKVRKEANGALAINWITKKAQDEFESHLRDLNTTAAAFIGSLITEYRETEWLEEITTKYTVYRTPSMPQGQWQVLKVKFTKEARRFVEGQHQGEKVTFANELVSKDKGRLK